ncbi:unnamed protein product, partial [Polarella glacialis]
DMPIPDGVGGAGGAVAGDGQVLNGDSADLDQSNEKPPKVPAEPVPVPPTGQAYSRGSSLPFPFLRAPWKRDIAVRSAPTSARTAPESKPKAERVAEGDAQEGEGSVDGAGAAVGVETPLTDGRLSSALSSGSFGFNSAPQPKGDEKLPRDEEPTEEEKEVDEDNLPDDEKAALQWERHRSRNRSLIVDVFEGQLRSQLTCCRCGNSSSTFEPFRYLSVPIPSNHMDRCTLRVVFFPVPSFPSEKPKLRRFSVTVPKSSTVKRVELALSGQLPVPMSSVLLAEVYRSRIHRYLDPNLPLSDIRAEDQLFAFEAMQAPQELMDYQERLAPSKPKRDRIEEPSSQPQVRVLMIQAMHRRVVDVCRSDGRTWAQRREVFGLPFVMSAASSWTYATLHDMLMIHAGRFLKPRRDRAGSPTEERQVPFVARIVNASGTACGACDLRNCTGCLLPKGSARLRLRAGLLAGAPSTAKIYLALDWVDSTMYDQEYVDSMADDPSVARASAAEGPELGGNEGATSGSVPLSACVASFAEAEDLKVENGNGVKCEKCETVVDAVKKIEIWREPDVFVLHIKRFHFSGEHFEKVSTPVEVPLKDLDLSPWIVGPASGSTAAYDLYGVACHKGGMSGGHYTSYCLNEGGGQEPVWLKFNDDTVTRVLLPQELTEINEQCYVIFYRKRAFSSSNMINYLSV